MKYFPIVFLLFVNFYQISSTLSWTVTHLSPPGEKPNTRDLELVGQEIHAPTIKLVDSLPLENLRREMYLPPIATNKIYMPTRQPNILTRIVDAIKAFIIKILSLFA